MFDRSGGNLVNINNAAYEPVKLALWALVRELKAAQTGMWLIRKYAVDKQSGQDLLNWLEPYEKFAYKKEGTIENLASKLKFSKSVVPKSNSPIGQDLIDKMVLLIKE